MIFLLFGYKEEMFSFIFFLDTLSCCYHCVLGLLNYSSYFKGCCRRYFGVGDGEQNHFQSHTVFSHLYFDTFERKLDIPYYGSDTVVRLRRSGRHMAGPPNTKTVSRAESLANPDHPSLSQPLSLINPGSLSML